MDLRKVMNLMFIRLVFVVCLGIRFFLIFNIFKWKLEVLYLLFLIDILNFIIKRL